MSQTSREFEISEMFNAISPTYDLVNRVLSFGIDHHWRKKLLKHLPETESIHLLDLATGTGDQIVALMKSGKVTSAVGIDLAEEMLEVGKKKLLPFSDVIELEVGSALDTKKPSESFDCATISFGIRNVGNPLKCLQEMQRVLKPGGKALILEFSLPKNGLIKALHLFYLRKILPLVGGMISGKKSAYNYLNETIEAFPYGDEFCDLMKEAGFSSYKAHPLSFGIATLYVGTK